MSLFERIKALMTSRSTQPCKPAKGTLVVVLTRSDTGQPVQGAQVTVKGPTPGAGNTDNLGAAIFTDRDPGDYGATITLPPNLAGYRMTLETPNGSVGAEGTTILVNKVAPIGNLAIEVYDDLGKPVPEVASVWASGPQPASQRTSTGAHLFRDVLAGTYEAFASVPADKYQVTQVSQGGVVVPAGGTGSVRLVVKRLTNVVTPKIEMEYRVVLRDRELSAHQDKKEVKIDTDDVTHVVVSASQSTGAPAYTGGATLAASPANVEVYIDPGCKSLLAGGKVTHQDLMSGSFKLYLKSKTKGKFTAKLTLDPANDPGIRIEMPAQEDMGVVELEATLHRYLQADLDGWEVDPGTDPVATYHGKLKDSKVPDQKPMTDAQKVAEGRIIHVQGEDKHARARLVLKKLAADQWPAGTESYDVVVNVAAASGGLVFYDVESGGASSPKLAVKVSDLQARDKEVWVEASADSGKALDVVLDIGLHRSDTPALHTADYAAKRRGDWARFTPVRIKEVKFEFTTAADHPPVWEPAKKRYFVNTDADPKGRQLDNDGAKGRTIKITATLTQEVKDVVVHFMLANAKANYTKAHWGAGLPDTFDWGKLDAALKAEDKSSPKKVMHFSAKTDAKGVAECTRLVLSRLGGDQFRIGAYIDQDPQIARFVDGHADLEKKKPTLSNEFEVWRKAYIQISRSKTAVLHTRASKSVAFEKAYAVIEEVDETQYDPVDLGDLVEHPKWQFRARDASGTNIICVGSHNKDKFHGLFKAPTATTTPKGHLIMCDAQWDPERGTLQNFKLEASVGTANYKNPAGNAPAGVFDPPLMGGTMKREAYFEWQDGPILHEGRLKVAVREARAHTSEIELTIPAKCSAKCTCGGGTAILPTAVAPAKCSVRLYGAAGPFAGESGSAGSPHCLIVVNPDSRKFNNTIAHEIGHMFGQVRKADPWHGLPRHDNQYEKRGGQGSHCKQAATESPDKLDKEGKKTYVNGTCVMFHSVTGNINFCDQCKADLRVRDLSDFFR